MANGAMFATGAVPDPARRARDPAVQSAWHLYSPPPGSPAASSPQRGGPSSLRRIHTRTSQRRWCRSASLLLLSGGGVDLRGPEVRQPHRRPSLLRLLGGAGSRPPSAGSARGLVFLALVVASQAPAAVATSRAPDLAGRLLSFPLMVWGGARDPTGWWQGLRWIFLFPCKNVCRARRFFNVI
jgi:hypothetical protein